MPNALRDAFRVALKRFFWPPWERFPCCSSPQNSILCSRRSGMRVTWPAHRSWDCIRMVYMLDRPARARTSVSGIRSCHLMLRSFLRQVVWKWFSFLAWHWYTVHVSHAYSSVGSTIALYTFSFVCRQMPLLFQMLACSLLKVALAFTILTFTWSSMVAFWARVLPR